MSKLHHIIRESSLTENIPVLFLFHGYGSDENDLFAFASELPKELLIISVRAPYPMHPSGYAWYAINFDAENGKWTDAEQAKKSKALIVSFIDDIIEKYPVNKNSVSLLGFSQGAILSYAVAFNYPNKIKNVIALSGYIDENIFDIQPKENYNHLSIYASHGVVDQVIPIDWARKAPNFLEQLSIKHKFSEFPVGHGVTPQNFYEFREWLAKQM